MKKLWLFVRILFVRLRFILVFVVLGLVVGNWALIMNVVERYRTPRAPRATGSEEFEWFCPMHPTVIRAEPGNCPICGMPLSKRKKGEKVELPEGVLSRVQLSPFRIAQAGIATTPAERRTLYRSIRSVGTIEYDEGLLTNLSARIEGRADETYVNFVGNEVAAGDPLYNLYSPELISTQKEYLLAVGALRRLEAVAEPGADTLKRARDTLESGRERLLLWGITEDQIAEIEAEGKVQTHLVIRSPVAGVVVEKNIRPGHHIEVGEDPYVIADLSSVWMMAEVFERDIGLVRVGQLVDIATEAYPGETFAGIVSLVEPALRTDTRTVRVRAQVANPERKLKPGMFVTAIVRAPLAPSGRAPFACCVGVASGPSACPKCATSGQAAPVEAGAGAEAPAPADGQKVVYVCSMHQLASLSPGTCDKCGGMRLEPLELGQDQRLVFTCPDHPDVVATEPAKCPRDGGHRDLENRVIPRPSAAPPAHACPLHPVCGKDDKLVCPECGHEMKEGEAQPVLSVPVSAVIDTGERRVVYVERRDGLFEAVVVVVGPRADLYYPIYDGLAEGDRVVTAGAFLLDAEAHLNPAAGSAFFGASAVETKR